MLICLTWICLVSVIYTIHSSDKDEPDADAMTVVLGLQNYRNGAYADELTSFRDHSHAGEIWSV